MKKIIAIALTLSLLAAPASAVTTGNWDMGTAQQSAANAATQKWQEQQKQDNPVEHEEPEVDKPCLPEWLLELIHAWKWW